MAMHIWFKLCQGVERALADQQAGRCGVQYKSFSPSGF